MPAIISSKLRRELLVDVSEMPIANMFAERENIIAKNRNMEPIKFFL